MANIKTGLAYYTVDTDRYMDIRIKRLKKALGCDGMAVYDYLLCEIYRDKGYFFEWNENSVFDVAEYFGLKETKVKGIVEFCASVGLFSKVLLGSGVLTSPSIQQRYVTMCNRAKRKEISIREDLLLIKLTEECPKLTEVCDKEKKSKEYHTQTGACEHETKCPYIQKLSKNQAWLDVICMQHQIHIEDALRWLERFDLDMQCSGAIHINMSDAQSHFNAWLKKELAGERKNTKNRKYQENENKTGRRVIAHGEIKDYGSSF